MSGCALCSGYAAVDGAGWPTGVVRVGSPRGGVGCGPAFGWAGGARRVVGSGAVNGARVVGSAAGWAEGQGAVGPQGLQGKGLP